MLSASARLKCAEKSFSPASTARRKQRLRHGGLVGVKRLQAFRDEVLRWCEQERGKQGARQRHSYSLMRWNRRCSRYDSDTKYEEHEDDAEIRNHLRVGAGKFLPGHNPEQRGGNRRDLAQRVASRRGHLRRPFRPAADKTRNCADYTREFRRKFPYCANSPWRGSTRQCRRARPEPAGSSEKGCIRKLKERLRAREEKPDRIRAQPVPRPYVPPEPEDRKSR